VSGEKAVSGPPQLGAIAPLDLPELERFWSNVTGVRSRDALAGAHVTSEYEELLLSGLGLHRRETYEFLMMQRPSYREFETWIVAQHGGALAPPNLTRLRAALRGEPTPLDLASDDVLDAEDVRSFRERGYVVLRDAVAPGLVRRAERAVWDFLEMDPSDPETWYAKPCGHSIWVPLLRHPAQVAIRSSPRIARAFAQLWNDADLWPTTDQAGFNPPERPDWPFPGPGLHWDCSLATPREFDLGGILYLTDTPSERGAFTTVPGFHTRLDAWLAQLGPEADPRSQDLEALGPVPIPAAAGDLIIWNQALPHGSRPNLTSRPRIVQYLSMRPRTYAPNPVWR
jgi:hypothetical protein